MNDYQWLTVILMTIFIFSCIFGEWIYHNQVKHSSYCSFKGLEIIDIGRTGWACIDPVTRALSQ